MMFNTSGFWPVTVNYTSNIFWINVYPQAIFKAIAGPDASWQLLRHKHVYACLIIISNVSQWPIEICLNDKLIILLIVADTKDP